MADNSPSRWNEFVNRGKKLIFREKNQPAREQPSSTFYVDLPSSPSQESGGSSRDISRNPSTPEEHPGPSRSVVGEATRQFDENIPQSRSDAGVQSVQDPGSSSHQESSSNSPEPGSQQHRPDSAKRPTNFMGRWRKNFGNKSDDASTAAGGSEQSTEAPRQRTGVFGAAYNFVNQISDQFQNLSSGTRSSNDEPLIDLERDALDDTPSTETSAKTPVESHIRAIKEGNKTVVKLADKMARGGQPSEGTSQEMIDEANKISADSPTPENESSCALSEPTETLTLDDESDG